METKLSQRVFHVMWIVLCVSLVLSFMPTAFAETGSRFLPGTANIFDTKDEIITHLGPFKRCPLTIEEALYDPYRDRVGKVRKPGELFNSNKKNQLLEGARLVYRLQRHFGTNGPNFPDYDPIPDIDIECGSACDDINLNKCEKPKLDICDQPHPPRFCEIMDRVKK